MKKMILTILCLMISANAHAQEELIAEAEQPHLLNLKMTMARQYTEEKTGHVIIERPQIIVNGKTYDLIPASFPVGTDIYCQLFGFKGYASQTTEFHFDPEMRTGYFLHPPQYHWSEIKAGVWRKSTRNERSKTIKIVGHEEISRYGVLSRLICDPAAYAPR